MRTPRLLPGSHLYRTEDGSWRHRNAEGDTLHLRGDDATLSRIQSLLARRAEPVEPLSPREEAAIDALRSQGLLQDDEIFQGEHHLATGRVIILDGEGPIAERTREVLARSCEVHTQELDEEVIKSADFVVSCDGWLPDSRWTRIDYFCGVAKKPWHRCYSEGKNWIIGPVFIPEETGNYRDTRCRLLAASTQPRELLSFWRYLETAIDLHPPEPPADGITELIVGVLVADVLTVLKGSRPPTGGDQVVVQPNPISLSRHPVLPIPTVWTSEREPTVTQ